MILSQAGTAAPTGDNGAPSPSPAPATAGAAPAEAQAAPWYAPRNDAEFSGWLQNKGLDRREAPDVAYEAFKMHREAEKLISRVTGTADKERILITPKPDAPEAEKNAFWERLGRPADPNAYDFKSVTFPDGTEIDQGFAAFLKSAAFKANMSKDAAESFARDAVAYFQQSEDADTAEAASKRMAEQEALKKSWGANYKANEFVADQAFRKLADAAGLPPERAVEALKVLGGAVGSASVAQFLLAAGKAFGEDRYVQNSAPGANGAMTREQAVAKLSELRRDGEWSKRFMNGDVRARNEFDALTAMAVEVPR